MQDMTLLATWTGFVTEAKFLNNEVWRWLVLLGLVLAGFVLGKVFSYFLSRQAQRLERSQKLPTLGMLIRSASGPAMLLVLVGGQVI